MLILFYIDLWFLTGKYDIHTSTMFFRTGRSFHNSLWNSRFVDICYEKTTFKIVPSCETPYIDAERGPRENCYVHLYSSILALAIYNSVGPTLIQMLSDIFGCARKFYSAPPRCIALHS